MKFYKLMVVALLSLATVGANAQKKEIALPEAGDIALGIDLQPLLKFVGNAFNGNTSNTITEFGGEPISEDGLSINPAVSIMGKYMLTDNIALRANLGLISASHNNRYYVYDDKARLLNPLSEQKLVDQLHGKKSGFSLALGGEYRRGIGRLQGYAGADLLFATDKEQYRADFANQITEINQMPSRVSLGTAYGVTPVNTPSYWTEAYVLEEKNKTMNTYFGLGLHVGVEFFLDSKVSVGGEVFLAALKQVGGQRWQTTEGFNTNTNMVETRTELVSPGNRDFYIGTENLGGKLFMMFYF